MPRNIAESDTSIPHAHLRLCGIGCGSDWRKYQFSNFVQSKTSRPDDKQQDYLRKYFDD
jgi:hypothetical protein